MPTPDTNHYSAAEARADSDQDLYPFEVVWACPKCGAENTDDYKLTALPSCGNCDTDGFDWGEIVSHEMLFWLNQALEMTGA